MRRRSRGPVVSPQRLRHTHVTSHALRCVMLCTWEGACCEHHTSHVAFSRTITRTCVAQVVCLSCVHHVSSSFVCSDSLRLLHFPLSADHLLSYHPVLPPAHQLHLPRCGGQIPCALQLMRTLAPLPSTTLSQVMSPTTTTSRRLLNPTSRNPRSSKGSPSDFDYDDVTICKALSGACRRRADHSQEEGLSSFLSSSVSHDRTARPVVKPFDSQISSVRETPTHCSESEQIRILLDCVKQRFENTNSRPIMTEEVFKR